MKTILSLAKRHGLKVVEDAAHALPTSCAGRLIGSLASDATVYSFYATKTITTGEGGMIVTRDPELAKRCRTMRLHGISRDAFDRYTSTKPSWHYEVVAPGCKYNMTDLAASLGIHQLKKAWSFQEKREYMATRYDEALSNLPVILPPKAPTGDMHAWHLYVIRLTNAASVTRDRFIELMAEKGVGCSVHFIPLHLHPYWRDRYNLKPEDFSNALEVYEGAVSLPLFTKMNDEDQHKVVAAVRDILG
jgi:dTDP-4-amino-4,6-dideoxygalactose transaminase